MEDAFSFSRAARAACGPRPARGPRAPGACAPAPRPGPSARPPAAWPVGPRRRAAPSSRVDALFYHMRYMPLQEAFCCIRLLSRTLNAADSMSAAQCPLHPVLSSSLSSPTVPHIMWNASCSCNPLIEICLGISNPTLLALQNGEWVGCRLCLRNQAACDQNPACAHGDRLHAYALTRHYEASGKQDESASINLKKFEIGC